MARERAADAGGVAVSPSRAGATSISRISAGHHAPTWCASSTITRPNRSPIRGAHDDRARVRRDRDRRDAMVAVAEPTDRMRPARRERARPLIEQHARRHEDQRRDAELGDRGERDERLAGAGRQHDHAAIAGIAPARERVALIPAQLAATTTRLERRCPLVQRADASGRSRPRARTAARREAATRAARDPM